jgi:TPR repeat protein
MKKIVFFILLIFLNSSHAFDNDELKKKCEANNFESCSRLAQQYDNGLGVHTNYFIAFELNKKACDGKNAEGCFSLAWKYEHGRAVRQDKSKALRLYGKACELKDNSGCERYSLLKNTGVKEYYIF